jgi:antitoxin component of MazEF toxin-antitoxin module
MELKLTTEGKVLKWGNSFGIRINKDVVEKLKLNEYETVELEIRKRDNPLKELFGAMPKLKITREEFMKNRKELEGDIDARWDALSRQLRSR